MLFKTDVEKAFGVETYLSPEMENAIRLWEQLENGKPPWVDKDTRTVRFSNTVARELAKLITQNIDIKVQSKYGTGDKAQFIQTAIDNHFLKNAQANMEKVIRLGGIMAKWNGSGIDYITPDRFLVTEFDSNGEITGVIFFSYHQKENKFYTRAEWHRYEDGTRKNEAGETEAVRLYDHANDINEALEVAKFALVRRIAKRPRKERKYFGLVQYYYCPSCGHYFGQSGDYSTLVKDRFCQGEGCGQAIDWS